MLKQTGKTLDIEDAVAIVERSETIVDAIVDLYRAVIDNFDDVEQIDGWPTVSKAASLRIYQAIGDRFGSNAMFTWMNNGFSSSEDVYGIPVYHQE